MNGSHRFLTRYRMSVAAAIKIICEYDRLFLREDPFRRNYLPQDVRDTIFIGRGVESAPSMNV